jgi:hypothetical protein
MKNFIRGALARAQRALAPAPRPRDPLVPVLTEALANAQAIIDRRDQLAFLHDLIEARQMGGSGPWLPYEARGTLNSPEFAESMVKARETIPVGSIGAYGDIELALQNVEWRREINITWLEFSRWGIQQIILICRLYYIKNPVIRRLINVCADYVFARGVEISSPDDTANEILAEFFTENKDTLGQHALMELEKRKDYDGNLFFAFFSDTQDAGKVSVRMIDAMEIMDVVSDPDDSTKPWYYRRIWTQKNFSTVTGVTSNTTTEAWYPALGYDPADKPPTIQTRPVMWDTPIYHRKAGHITTWTFGCPRAYPAIDWARTAKDYLTNCASVAQALSEIARTITTKGGQQALEGIKQQLQTQVGPAGGQSLWDSNPPAVTGATFASGPGTKIEAFKTQGAGQDPEKVRQYKLYCCMVFGVPETFLADVATGNLATATSLDRPTETGFLAKQEVWIEDLTTIAMHVLKVSSRAPKGKLREAAAGKDISIIEMRRSRNKNTGRLEYFPLSEAKTKSTKSATVEVKVSFPAIREGDTPAQVKAVVEALTLDNRGGQIVGIDEKEGVRKLLELLDVPGADELIEQMYPKDYDPDRTVQDVAAPIGRAQLAPGGAPQLPGGRVQQAPEDKKIEAALKRLARAFKVWEAATEDHGSHEHREHEHAGTSNGR